MEEKDRDEVIEGVGDPAKEKTLAEPPDSPEEDAERAEEEEKAVGEEPNVGA